MAGGSAIRTIHRLHFACCGISNSADTRLFHYLLKCINFSAEGHGIPTSFVKDDAERNRPLKN